MNEQLSSTPTLSAWWRRSVLLVFVIGMIGLIFMSVQAYRYAPPIPEKVVASDGKMIFSGQEIKAGQQVFLKYGLMQNGSIWGTWLLFRSGFFGAVPARTLAGNRTGNRQTRIWCGYVGIRRLTAGPGRIPGRYSSQRKSLRSCIEVADLHRCRKRFFPQSANCLDRLFQASNIKFRPTK